MSVYLFKIILGYFYQNMGGEEGVSQQHFNTAIHSTSFDFILWAACEFIHPNNSKGWNMTILDVIMFSYNEET